MNARVGVVAAGESGRRQGVLFAIAANIVWGFMPAYFKLMDGVLATEIVAQRIIWSVLFLAGIIGLRRGWPTLMIAARNPRNLVILCASALLIAINWFVYIWAVEHDRVLEGSLGYFLTPIVNVIFGVVLLKERLTRAQTVAVILAATGVALLAAGALSGLWITLVLAFSFGTYGLLRKIAPVEALEGLAIETSILAPAALAYIVWLGAADRMSMGDDVRITVLLLAAGVITALPLLMFAAAARRLPYALVGLLQYIAPTIQFLLAVFLFHEPLTTAHLLCFGMIWTGLAIYAFDEHRMSRRTA